MCYKLIYTSIVCSLYCFCWCRLEVLFCVCTINSGKFRSISPVVLLQSCFCLLNYSQHLEYSLWEMLERCETDIMANIYREPIVWIGYWFKYFTSVTSLTVDIESEPSFMSYSHVWTVTCSPSAHHSLRKYSELPLGACGSIPNFVYASFTCYNKDAI